MPASLTACLPACLAFKQAPSDSAANRNWQQQTQQQQQQQHIEQQQQQVEQQKLFPVAWYILHCSLSGAALQNCQVNASLSQAVRARGEQRGGCTVQGWFVHLAFFFLASLWHFSSPIQAGRQEGGRGAGTALAAMGVTGLYYYCPCFCAESDREGDAHYKLYV